MRTVQFIGNTEEADNIIFRCRRGNSVESIYGFGSEIVCNLYEWFDDSGKKWTEYVQYEIWSSGPMIFTAIRSENGNIVGWKRVKTSHPYYYDKEFDREKGEIYI